MLSYEVESEKWVGVSNTGDMGRGRGLDPKGGMGEVTSLEMCFVGLWGPLAWLLYSL